MVRGSRVLFHQLQESIAAAADGSLLISKTLSDVLVCPLSKQPLRLCRESKSLISDAVGVSFPIVDGIPCLVPKDGKFLEDNSEPKSDAFAD